MKPLPTTMIVGAISAFSLASAANAGDLFKTYLDFYSVPGGGAGNYEVGDVNGDGRLDLVSANRQTSMLETMVGQSDNSFSASSATTTTLEPWELALADFNGDGLDDVVIADSEISLEVLFSNGDGTFTSAFLTTLPFGPDSGFIDVIDAADLNGDGHADVALCEEFFGRWRILFGAGDGTFGDPVAFAGGYQSYDEIQLVDLNGDGHLDLFVVVEVGIDSIDGGSVKVWLNDGAGNFSWAWSISLYDPTDVALGHLDNDGILDLAYLVYDEWYGDQLIYRYGDGDGTFGAANVLEEYGINGPSSVAIGDITGDGFGEILTADDSVTIVRINSSDRDFGDPFTVLSHGAPFVHDLNNDGDNDLLGLSQVGVAVHLNEGDDPFDFPGVLQPLGFDVNGSIAVGDLDLDGLTDFVVAQRQSDTLYVYHNDGGLTFSQTADYAAGAYPGDARIADFDGDGWPDVFLRNSDQNLILLNAGDGTLGSSISLGVGVGAYPQVADLDNDGDPDIVSTNFFGGMIWVALNDGAGNLASAPDVASGDYPTYPHVADINQDGMLDIVYCAQGDDAIGICQGNGDGTFQPRTLMVFDAFPHQLHVGDLNGDDAPDLVYKRLYDDYVLLNNGDGTFQTETLLTIPFTLSGAQLADVDQDGDLDLVGGEAAIEVALNDGAGAFPTTLEYGHGGHCYSPTLSDLDGDGDLDAIRFPRATESFFIVPGILCPNDLTGDGDVNADDLFALLGAWGDCSGCPEDLTGDDLVNADDLFALLGNWGPCAE